MRMPVRSGGSGFQYERRRPRAHWAPLNRGFGGRRREHPSRNPGSGPARGGRGGADGFRARTTARRRSPARNDVGLPRRRGGDCRARVRRSARRRGDCARDPRAWASASGAPAGGGTVRSRRRIGARPAGSGRRRRRVPAARRSAGRRGGASGWGRSARVEKRLSPPESPGGQRCRKRNKPGESSDCRSLAVNSIRNRCL